MLALGAAPARASEHAGVSSAAALRSSHVFVVVLENREYEEVIGNPQADYINRLAKRGALAVDYFGVTHPSLPNYLALFAGDTFGITENCADCLVTGPNLATQLSRAGISWRAYMEGLPYPCFPGADFDRYAKRHNPFAYFPSIMALPKRCENVMPGQQLALDLKYNQLPSFGWLTPDLCYDGHDCGLGAVDFHLYKLLPKLVRQLGPHGLLVLTFDEGLSNAGCCGSPGGGHIATIIVGPDVPRGKQILQPADHYSLLASLEDRFGLSRLRNARAARPLAPALFRATG